MRFQVAMIVALMIASSDVHMSSVARTVDADTRAELDHLLNRTRLPLAGHAPLRPYEKQWGEIAWKYFSRYVDPKTGLADSVAGYHAAALWETGSYLLGAISAERLGILDRGTFDTIVSRALHSLAAMPLFQGRVPNKVYNIQTLEMVDYNNNPAPDGIGFSPLDIGRLLFALTMIQRGYPDHDADVRRVVNRWDLALLAKDAQLQGASLQDGTAEFYQEGRLGYEQYAARIISTYYLDVRTSLDDRVWTGLVNVDGVSVPYDLRSRAVYNANTYSISDPYLLMGLEWGLDDMSRAYSDQLYLAQVHRHQRTGILTSVGEGHINRPPYFLYSSVYANGHKWAVLDPAGNRHDDLRLFSTKSAFCYDALYRTSYTQELVKEATPLNNPNGGWFVGKFESGGLDDVASADTNGMILESLYYRQFGPIALSIAK